MNDPTTPTPNPADASPSPTPVPSAADPAPAPVANAPVRPEGLDERFFDAEKGVKWEDLNKEIADLAQFKADAEAARKVVPEKADEYKLEFEDGVLPEGFELNPDDPAWPKARELAHKLGLDQKQFGELAAAHLQLKAAEETALQGQLVEMQKAEAAKLGPNAAAMSDAVTQWINATFDPEAAKVFGASGILVNASVLKSFNKVITGLANAGVTFNADGRVTGQNGITPEAWEKMTPAARLAATWKPAAGRA